MIGAFRKLEAVQIELEGKKAGIFPLEEYGIPYFYELVIVTHTQDVQEHSWRVQGFTRAVSRGIQWTLRNPAQALEIFLERHPNLGDELNRRIFQATLPLFKRGHPQDTSRWIELQRLMLEHGPISNASKIDELVWEEEPRVP